MLVKEVIEHLKYLPQDMEVLLAKDEEGNCFRRIPDNWIGLEKFYEDNYELELIHPDDYNEYDNLTEYVLIG